MLKLKNVLLSLLVVSVLNGCGGFVAKDIIILSPRLFLPTAASDKELGCLSVDVYGKVITRDGLMVERINTLRGQIGAHNAN